MTLTVPGRIRLRDESLKVARLPLLHYSFLSSVSERPRTILQLAGPRGDFWQGSIKLHTVILFGRPPNILIGINPTCAGII